jgi:nicotinate-nucleotide pyrophosphorylase (carboxylating)
VIAGLPAAAAAIAQIDARLRWTPIASDGAVIQPGDCVARIEGPARGILSAERLVLNLLGRLSGIATLTRRFVEAVAGTKARIYDTRKTTPGWRRLEKYAVQCGGGVNHRMGLFDRILIKDNHLAALRGEPPNAIEAAVRRARAQYPHLAVEVEADTLEQAGQACRAGADVILLDNMSHQDLRAAVRLIDGRAKTEASGGVNLATVRAIAETGVDFISVGALTHSAPAADIALDFQT